MFYKNFSQKDSRKTFAKSLDSYFVLEERPAWKGTLINVIF